MAQEHQVEDSVDLATHNMQRKRGRPRKEGISGSEPYKRTQRCKVDVEAHGNDPFVGQVVSGVLDGKFDAGYMLTVRVGERGNVLRGIVFEPGLSVPISAANDIAPNVKMFKRDEVSLPSSAWQLSCCAPVRSRNDGAVGHRQRRESALPKGVCVDITAEDLNANAQMHSSEDIKIQKNDSNLTPGNLKQDLLSTSGVIVPNDGNQHIQSSNVSAECSRETHLCEVIGNPSMVASNSCKIASLQDVAGDVKLNVQLSQTLSESKPTATSDGTLGFSSDIMIANLQEVADDVNRITGTFQHISEAKRTVETSVIGPELADDNKMVHLHEIVSDSKPVTEVSQTKVSESEQLSETIDSRHAFMTGASDDYSEAPLLVTIQVSEHVTGGVDDLGEATHTAESAVDESTGLHSVKLAVADRTVEVAGGTDSSLGQESQVHLETVVPGSSKAVELASELLKDDASATHVIPEQQGDLATLCGESTMVSSVATTQVTNGSSQVAAADATNGSSQATAIDAAIGSPQRMEGDITNGSSQATAIDAAIGSPQRMEVDITNGSSQATEVSTTYGGPQATEVDVSFF